MKAISMMISVFVVASAASAQFATPAKEISDLKWMVGTWETKGTFSMMGQEMEMTMEWTVTMEGPFIKGVSKQTIMGMDVMETSYLYYDAAKKELVMNSYTNLSDSPRVERGKAEANQVLLFSDPWMVMGNEMQSRSLLKKVSADEMSFKLEMKNGDSWDLASESVFKRKK